MGESGGETAGAPEDAPPDERPREPWGEELLPRDRSIRRRVVAGLLGSVLVRRGARRVGPCVGPFDGTSLLGRGAFGEVHRARHETLDIDVAVKLIDPIGASRDEWLDEARRMARLGPHPHVLFVHDTGVADDGRVYVVMPIADGSLRDLLPYGVVLPSSRALEVVRQVAGGLCAVHARGLVHLDLKPTNIFRVEHEGLGEQLMIGDFGLARAVRPVSTGSRIGGTAPFASPELLAGSVDERADLWALGVILFRMTTGRLPFEGATAPELLARIVRGDRARVSELRAGSSPALEALVERMLARAPEDRFPSARSVREAASDLRRGLPSPRPFVLPAADFREMFAGARGESFSVRMEVARADAPPRTRDAFIEPDHGAFRVGDVLRVGVESGRDGWLTLLDLGTSGRLTTLYPNPIVVRRRLRAGEMVWLPEEGDGFRYRLGGPPGRELLIAIASREELDLGRLGPDRGRDFTVLAPEAGRRDDELLLFRELLARLPADSWASQSIVVVVEE